MIIFCHRCGAKADKSSGGVNRSRAIGAPLYCSRKCAGIARMKHKTKGQKTMEKRIYDAGYRKANLVRLKAQKRARFLATYDPVKAAIERKKNMPRHVEYCRQPEYKLWKSAYDRRYRAKKYFGPFAEAAMLAVALNKEIKSRMTNHEIKCENKTANKTQTRKREANQKDRRRPRGRSRDRHTAAIG